MNYNDLTLDELKRLVAADEADEIEAERKSMEKKEEEEKEAAERAALLHRLGVYYIQAMMHCI